MAGSWNEPEVACIFCGVRDSNIMLRVAVQSRSQKMATVGWVSWWFAYVHVGTLTHSVNCLFFTHCLREGQFSWFKPLRLFLLFTLLCCMSFCFPEKCSTGRRGGIHPLAGNLLSLRLTFPSEEKKRQKISFFSLQVRENKKERKQVTDKLML